MLMKRGDMKKAIFLTSFLFISMDTMGNSISIENSGFSVSYKARVTLFPVTKNKPTEFSNEVVEWSNSDNVVESSEFFSLYDDYSRSSLDSEIKLNENSLSAVSDSMLQLYDKISLTDKSGNTLVFDKNSLDQEWKERFEQKKRQFHRAPLPNKKSFSDRVEGVYSSLVKSFFKLIAKGRELKFNVLDKIRSLLHKKNKFVEDNFVDADDKLLEQSLKNNFSTKPKEDLNKLFRRTERQAANKISECIIEGKPSTATVKQEKVKDMRTSLSDDPLALFIESKNDRSFISKCFCYYKKIKKSYKKLSGIVYVVSQPKKAAEKIRDKWRKVQKLKETLSIITGYVVWINLKDFFTFHTRTF